MRFAKAARSQAVSDLRGDRRPATLVAFAAVMPELAADEAIEVFDLVMGDIIRSSATTMTKQRLRTLKDLDAAAIELRTAWLGCCHVVGCVPGRGGARVWWGRSRVLVQTAAGRPML
ncbi:hypothetical protein OHA79_43670 [Streptomyces sp. NBC_00841]|uniref:hypothetical protein n=1 Tax=unclassified Streptomyces TaxID=2593676 RepID=UPI002254CAAE|nr:MULTISPECIES: hypothetical protein [unclassified Streptomyces]MCX4530138.1 hypothetical protein [Streptomyces sp. NBC_01669]WSA04077.1 hypothetical protein OHA79_43670 [Streptomyces sp. NBC_00841]